MELQKTIHGRLETVIRGFLERIADKYNIEYDELCEFANNVNFEGGSITKPMNCLHRMISGKNKGKYLERNRFKSHGIQFRFYFGISQIII